MKAVTILSPMELIMRLRTASIAVSVNGKAVITGGRMARQVELIMG